MKKLNLSDVITKYRQLEKEYTELLNKYKSLEEILKRNNLILFHAQPPDNNADIVWSINLQGRTTFVTQSIRQFTGYTEKEYVALSIDEIFLPESARKVKNAICKSNADDYKKLIKEETNAGFSVNLEYRCIDGSTKWGKVTIRPVFDGDGRFVAINGVTESISVSDYTKSKLITSRQEQQFIDLLEHFPTMVFIHSNNKLVYANHEGKVALNVSDVNKEEIDVCSRVKEEYKPVLKEAIDLRCHGKPVESFNLEVLDRFNRYRPVVVRSTDIVFNNRSSVLSMVTDVSEQVASEKIIRESETKFFTLANFSPYAIMIYQDDFWVYANPAATTICEYSVDELYAMKYWDIIHPDYVGLAKNKSKERILGRDLLNEYEFKIITKNGVEKWVQTIGNTIIFKDKKAVLISVSDITKQKNEDKELQEAKNKAEASDRLKTAFLNNISHEIRTPLNGILNFGEMLIDPSEPEENKKFYYSILNQSVERLLDTINDYMDMSLIVSNNIAVRAKEFNVRSCAEKVEKKYAHAIAEKNFNFSFYVLGFENDIADTDEELFGKILNHLISNAIKFTPENGSIFVSICKKEDQLNIEVEDDGAGVSESAIAEIFFPFNQGDNASTHKFEGSGLGLAIIKGFVDLLHGTVHVDSAKNKGTRFCINIPFERTKEQVIISSRKALEVNKTLPVLIVEDETSNRLFLRLLLEKYGLEVVEASDGRQAVDIIRSSMKFSVILMDIKMPVMDGIEATRQIKAIDQTIPIIATTAYAMRGDEQNVLDAGCDDYISKPIVKDILFGKLKKLGLIQTNLVD